jgi:hypothetical protein
VDVSGSVARQVLIQLKPAQMASQGVGVDEVVRAIQGANMDVPAGRIEQGPTEQLVRVEGKIKDPAGFNKIIVARRAKGPVYLSEVADVVDGEREADNLSRINGKPGISVNVLKVQDANIVEVGEGVKKAAAALNKELPSDVKLEIVYADVEWISKALHGVKVTIVEARSSIFIVFLFLHSWRSTIITGLTLPISVIATFTAVYVFGFTLNFITLMALSLCIGLLIDDAIVVRENIVRHLGMGRTTIRPRAGHRRDRPRRHGDHVRDRGGVRSRRLHEGHHRPLLLPVRDHRRGGGPGVALRELHAGPDALRRLARSGRNALQVRPVAGPHHDAHRARRGEGARRLRQAPRVVAEQPQEGAGTRVRHLRKLVFHPAPRGHGVLPGQR